MHVWIVRVDRRVLDPHTFLPDLETLATGVEGLTLELLPFDQAPDAGAFRDFIPVARISHAHIPALEYVAEALLESHDWLVDFQPVDP